MAAAGVVADRLQGQVLVDPGIVDQHVDTAMGSKNIRDDTLPIVRTSDIERDGEHRSSRGPCQDRRQGLGWSGVDIGYGHRCAFGGKSAHNGRANAPLDQIATLLGFPGKMGMSGAKVFDAFQDGDIKGIRDYCETDVLNTWLVYLRFQLMRGDLDPTGYEQELSLLQDYLKEEGQPHFLSFLEAWQKGS